MGSGESTTRKVSFGVDDEDRVRILRGVKVIMLIQLSSQGERETALGKIMSLEREQTRQEAEKTKVLAQQLQKKDSQLRALDAFYKEQLAQLEKRNWEEYEHSKERFHEAVSKTESSVRYHSVDPVCLGLQAQILSCYRENKDQTLTCSNLAKEYMQCINAAKKVRILFYPFSRSKIYYGYYDISSCGTLLIYCRQLSVFKHKHIINIYSF
uniref:CHCH domain-containing protein n=1 Tax=Cynoglossus semilaevis TaxID=244447 RepID=A0A3P8UR39_CYNSE